MRYPDPTVMRPKHVILERLNEASHGTKLDFFFRTVIYPKLTRFAEKRLGPDGVASMLYTAISEAIVDVPEELAESAYKLMPHFIDAIVPDERVAEEAKKIASRQTARYLRCTQLF